MFMDVHVTDLSVYSLSLPENWLLPDPAHSLTHLDSLLLWATQALLLAPDEGQPPWLWSVKWILAQPGNSPFGKDEAEAGGVSRL